MNVSINVVRITLTILFGIYQFWAFRNNKSVRCKLSPMILAIALGLLISALASFVGAIGYFFIFTILIIELSIMGAILVFLLEICLALFSNHVNLKRVMNLVGIFTLLVVIYYLVERVI
ncbi:hypothetical protein [Clostridium sp. CF012]|uniref:hypothetical protein n=1 Tax=Clostridium sp. CF012 TaxID=2843319 RepID=UPI001C0DA7A8|nr:hypothetical protein [Clostridium sp. CF012]MBU3144860.1 hypothetical protein [Clostridium sp. CF012]